MTKNSDPRQDLKMVSTEARLLHSSVAALRVNIEELSRNLLFRASNEVGVFSDSTGPFHAPNLRGKMVVLARDAGAEFAGAAAMLRMLEESDDYKVAAAVIDPLLVAIARLEAEEERHAEEIRRGEQAVTEARENARRKALEQAENEPEVVEAKKRLSFFRS